MSGYLDANGEASDDAPSYAEALILLDQTERKLRGALLRVGALEMDREAAALNDPARPMVDLLHALHKRATGRRRALDANDRENIAAVVKRPGGFRKALYAIAGAAYDPYVTTRRNGTKDRKNDIELVFRDAGKVSDFAARAPRGWEPNAEAIAEIGGVEVEWVRGLIGTQDKEKR